MTTDTSGEDDVDNDAAAVDVDEVVGELFMASSKVRAVMQNTPEGVQTITSPVVVTS